MATLNPIVYLLFIVVSHLHFAFVSSSKHFFSLEQLPSYFFPKNAIENQQIQAEFAKIQAVNVDSKRAGMQCV